jgi:hypothetical protein
MLATLCIIALMIFIAAVIKGYKGTPEGQANPAMICPHCQTRGSVFTKGIDQKKGVSGGKATAAMLTGGVSLLATGLSRKEHATQAHCANCKNIWTF